METEYVSRESGVLKLVYPGGFVELYRTPITAAEVMIRNPRHCVTRPDVFKFPWIVVKPESVLKPGRVFYVVPKYTIHQLMQPKGGSRNRAFPADDYSSHRLKVTSRMESCIDEMDLSTQRQGHGRMHREQDLSEVSSKLSYNFHRVVKKGNPVVTEHKVNTRCEDWSEDFSGLKFLVGPDKKYKKKFYRTQSLTFRSQFDLKTEQDYQDYSPKKQHKNQQPGQENRHVNLLLEDKPLFSVKHDSRRTDKVHDFLPKFDSKLDHNSSQKVTKLKSCLKKNNNIPKERVSRVRFAMDYEDHKNLGSELERNSPA